MLNDLNKNHMGGLENYAADEFYNVDDTWGDNKQPIKPKVKCKFKNGLSIHPYYKYITHPYQYFR